MFDYIMYLYGLLSLATSVKFSY